MTDLLTSGPIAHVQAVLAHWDLLRVMSVEPVPKSQAVFRVTTVGPTFTLKDVTDAPDLSRLEFTRAVLKHVARSSLQVPVPILSRSGQVAVSYWERIYLLAQFIEAGEYPSDPGQIPELFYQAGQAIARLHAALASYPDKEVSRQTWREDLAGNVGGWISSLATGLPEPQAALVKRVGLVRGAAIERALRGLPEQLIHRDCHPGNILVQGTRVVGFIDCDHLCIGPRLFDLASYAIHHLKWVTDYETATQRWLTSLPRLLNGYRSDHDLSPAEAAAFPHALMAYHLLLAHWFMGTSQWEPIALELRSLDWLSEHLDPILSATRSG
jgi:Ser/Thr protein kinase RdoA (MazF antagonist)